MRPTGSPVVAKWLEASPRDEMALFEWIRLTERTEGREAAEKVALEAHRRLPWEPAYPLWVVRMRVEQGRIDDAIEFLDDLCRRQTPSHSTLSSRLADLREQKAMGTDGRRN